MIPRRRTAALLTVTLIAGLATRRVDALPYLVEDHGGDALWATAVVLGLALVWPARRPGELALGGYAIAVAVEVSQLWAPAWLEDLRANDLAALVLGRGFLAAELARYAAGCMLGLVLLWSIRSDGPTAPS